MRDMKKKARGYSKYPEESVVDREMSRQGEIWKLKGQQEERGSRGLTEGLKETAEGNEETTIRIRNLPLASHFLFCEEL